MDNGVRNTSIMIPVQTSIPLVDSTVIIGSSVVGGVLLLLIFTVVFTMLVLRFSKRLNVIAVSDDLELSALNRTFNEYVPKCTVIYMCTQSCHI